jgi:carotenoid cleavage dioxygenase-like enzyme
VGPVKNTANTHVVRHAGRTLALMEGQGPIEIDEHDLATVGPTTSTARCAAR